ncbi:MAG: hypothetical protein GXP28_01835 [Planctomycetes bacterium]|nr:hypothetical protein [Planctomycetota bacterium]
MPKPLVIAHHLIWTAYGWWLPNDPRGSGSKIVRNASLAELGDLHYGRRTNQPKKQEIHEFYNLANKLLRHDLLKFDRKAITVAARGLANCITKSRYTCYACTIMPDHVHLIIRKHKHTAEEMIENLQSLSRQRLVYEECRVSEHPVWTVGGWKRFLDRPSAVRRVIEYIERNPLEIGRPRQQWPFVTLYDDWPLHPGHSPNSPYAQRLRAHR